MASHAKKGKGVKKSRQRPGKSKEGEEAGEETDEGDMEGVEVDYMSRSSSESEEEFQVCVHLLVSLHFSLSSCCSACTFHNVIEEV